MGRPGRAGDGGTTDDESGSGDGRRPDVPSRTPCRGRGSAGPRSAVGPRQLAPGARSPRSHRSARGAGGDPTSRPGPDPVWPDGGLALRFLPGRPCRWPPTLHRCHEPRSSFSYAAMRTCRTSGCSPRPSEPSCSTSRISTRTLHGPFEDLKRLAASLVLASRSRGLEHDGHHAVHRAIRSYQTRMAAFATMRAIDVYYAQVTPHRSWASRISTLDRSCRRPSIRLPP